MMFTCCPDLIFLTSPCLEIYRFSNGSFCYFEQFKVTVYFANFGQVKIDPICSYLLTRHAINNPNLFLLIKNSRARHRAWHKPFSVVQSGGIKNWFLQSINMSQGFSLLFLSVACFLIFVHDENKDKKFYKTGGNIF